jgi:hypothetical protein
LASDVDKAACGWLECGWHCESYLWHFRRDSAALGLVLIWPSAIFWSSGGAWIGSDRKRLVS